MKILVPYAGSKYSLGVLRLVAKMALNPGSHIKILNVVPEKLGAMALTEGSDKSLHQQLVMTQKSRHLRDLAGELQFWQKECTVDSLAYFGNPKSSIIKVADDWGADLIVVGANDDNRIKKLIYGSVARHVMANADCSVMIVKPTPEIQEGSMGSNGYKVLLPLEGSVYSHETVSWMAGQVWKEGTQFKLLMAMPQFDARVEAMPETEDQLYLNESWTRLKESAFAIMEEHALNLGRRVGNSHVTIEVLPGSPKQAIMETAKKWNPDMIAMGSQADGGLTNIFSDSVPSHIVESSDCAVLVVRRRNGARPLKRKLGQVNLSEVLGSIRFSSTSNHPHDSGDIAPHSSVMM